MGCGRQFESGAVGVSVNYLPISCRMLTRTHWGYYTNQMTHPDMSATSDFGHIFATPRVSNTLEILDDACTTFRSEHIISIRAQLRSRFFLRRFMWTGSDDDEPPDLETTHDVWGHPKHRIHGPIVREGRWRVIVVDLGSTFEVGDEDTLHFRHQLRDLNGEFEPFLGHAPKLGTEYLMLQGFQPVFGKRIGLS